MDNHSLQQLLTELIAKTNKYGGATYDFKSKSFVEPIDYWYFPKYPGLTLIVNRAELSSKLTEFINGNYKKLFEPDTVFGTWANPASKKIYLDINIYVKDKSTAVRQAKVFSIEGGRNIVSIYNPYLKETVLINR